MTQNQRTLSSLLILILMVLLSAFCSSADADEGWRLRAGGVWLDPDGDSERQVDGDRVTTRGDQDFGLGVTLERRFNSRLGLEIGAPVMADPELRVRVVDGDDELRVHDDVGMKALTAGVNLHLTPGRRADVYIGPFAGVALVEHLEFTTSGERFRFDVGDELTYGAVLGVDVPISERWGVCASARWMALEIDPVGDDGGSTPIDFDSVALAAGVSIGF